MFFHAPPTVFCARAGVLLGSVTCFDRQPPGFTENGKTREISIHNLSALQVFACICVLDSNRAVTRIRYGTFVIKQKENNGGDRSWLQVRSTLLCQSWHLISWSCGHNIPKWQLCTSTFLHPRIGSFGETGRGTYCPEKRQLSFYDVSCPQSRSVQRVQKKIDFELRLNGKSSVRTHKCTNRW